jgi:hypothetical protein
MIPSITAATMQVATVAQMGGMVAAVDIELARLLTIGSSDRGVEASLSQGGGRLRG